MESKWIKTLQAKSDQLNSDDLIGGDKIIKITAVKVDESSDQPAIMYYEGDGGKPFKPCKSVRRLIAHCWGGDESLYVGRYMQLYRDESVRWAGEAIGGIRIKAMSHIQERKKVSLQIAKGKRISFIVDVMNVKQDSAAVTVSDELRQAMTDAATTGTESLQEFWKALTKEQRRGLQAHLDECKKVAEEAERVRAEEPSDSSPENEDQAKEGE